MKNWLIRTIGIILLLGITYHPAQGAQKGSAKFVYGDREVTVPGLKRAWGFTALIKYDGKTVLFNTGGNEEILKNNFDVLGIKPKDLDAVVISHQHWEMYQALGFIMKENPKLPIYTTGVVIQLLRGQNPAWGPNLHNVSMDEQLSPNIYLQTLKSGPRRGGPFGIYEVHIVLKTDKGLVIFQGCGHPQILNIVNQSKALTGVGKVNLVAGGTRLLRPGTRIQIQDSGEDFIIPQMNYNSDEYYTQLMADLKKAGVKYVMPTHCTLEPAEGVFKQSFGDKYIYHTLGKILEFPILK